MFTATEFYTKVEKEVFARKLLNFVDKGFKRTMFNKPIYRHLNGMFGHIAHYNIEGFYYEWFSTPNKQKDWIYRVINWRIYGDPAYTFSDVERNIQNELLDRELKC